MEPRTPRGKKLRILSGFLKGYPVWCTWQVTYNCNYGCDFCDYWQGKHSGEMDLEGFRLGSENLASIGSMMISMAGGEPLLRKDLPDIVSLLARHHFPLMTTHGWFMTQQKATELWEAGLWGASVSIDHIDPETHDLHRGQKGAFEHAVQAIKNLVATRTKPHQRINLMCVLKNDNLHEVEALIQLAGDLGAKFMIQPYGSLKIGNTEFNSSVGASEHLLRLKKRYRNFLSNPYYLEQFDVFAATGGIPSCHAGRSFFNIDNHGNVAKCVEHRQTPIGNVIHDPIQELLARLKQENRQNKCQACWYNCRGEIESLYTIKGLKASLPMLLS